MPRVITGPTETVRQLSGQLPDQIFYLSVVVKQTYRIDPRGRCVLAETQLPLQEDVTYEDEEEELVSADTDLLHFKPLTDVIVRGHGYAREPQAEMAIGLRIGMTSKLVVATGERRATVSATGKVLFSRPEPFTKIPLTFALAYGGRDRAAEAKYGIPIAQFIDLLRPIQRIEALSPYLYPRNPCGRGYLVGGSPEAIEGLELPRIEDPEDRLKPERMFAGSPGHWTEMPVPQSLGWLGHTWFPRAAFFGVIPEYEGPGDQLREIAKKWIPADIMRSCPPQERFSMRATNGGSLGLQVPYLRGDEDGTLHNLSPLNPKLPFKLPGQRPRIWTDGRKGKFNQTEPVIHTVLIEPDEMRLSIVWRGNAPALRPYSDEELSKMPLRVEWP